MFTNSVAISTVWNVQNFCRFAQLSRRAFGTGAVLVFCCLHLTIAVNSKQQSILMAHFQGCNKLLSNILLQSIVLCVVVTTNTYMWLMGRDSSVGIATRYYLDSLGISSAPVQTGPGTHPTYCTMGTESFPGIKWPGRGVGHPPQSSAEVNERVEL